MTVESSYPEKAATGIQSSSAWERTVIELNPGLRSYIEYIFTFKCVFLHGKKQRMCYIQGNRITSSWGMTGDNWDIYILLFFALES